MASRECGDAALTAARPGAAATPLNARARLLALRIAHARAEAGAAPDLRSAESTIGDAAPLSWAQQALWLVDRLTGPNSVYNMAASARLKGPLRVDLLERALQGLVARHESLRTAIEDEDGQPVQRVLPDAPITLPVESFEALEAGAREEALRRTLVDQARVPFDLTQAPLIRARLYRLQAHEHVLLLVLHHIAADGWSRSVIARDLGVLYAALVDGADPTLPALQGQFADAARLQRTRTASGALRPALDYWTDRLAGLAPLDLPLDHARAAHPSHRGNVVGFRVESAQVDPARGTRAARRRDAVHDLARRVRHLACPLQRTDRHRGGLSDHDP